MPTWPRRTWKPEMPRKATSMKCLSLWQPWAQLVVDGLKSFETRDWSTSYRGRLLIHAAQRMETDVNGVLDGILQRRYGHGWRFKLPRGELVGGVLLNDCHKITTAWMASGPVREGSDEWWSGNYEPGRYAWALSNPQCFIKPIVFHGGRKLFDVPDSVVSEGELQLGLV